MDGNFRFHWFGLGLWRFGAQLYPSWVLAVDAGPMGFGCKLPGRYLAQRLLRHWRDSHRHVEFLWEERDQILGAIRAELEQERIWGVELDYDEHGYPTKTRPGRQPTDLGIRVYAWLDWAWQLIRFSLALPGLTCAIKGHDLVDRSYGGPDSGNMDHECKRCGMYWNVPLY